MPENNRSLWGDRFIRTRSDLLEIEEQFATEIADVLGLRLTGEQREELTRRYTENVEAYQLYLRGRLLLEPEIEGRVRTGHRSLQSGH